MSVKVVRKRTRQDSEIKLLDKPWAYRILFNKLKILFKRQNKNSKQTVILSEQNENRLASSF